MFKVFVLLLTIFHIRVCAADGFTIRLAHDSDAEKQTRDALIAVLKDFNVEKWTFTTNIVIDESVIPHSHPVLTLGARTRNDRIALLADFVHEQAHWFEEKNLTSVRKAIRELEEIYPNLPTTPPDGANGRGSTYLHLVVCYWEYEAVSELAGEKAARATLEVTAKHHYRSVYRTVLDHGGQIREVLTANNLLIPDR